MQQQTNTNQPQQMNPFNTTPMTNQQQYNTQEVPLPNPYYYQYMMMQQEKEEKINNLHQEQTEHMLGLKRRMSVMPRTENRIQRSPTLMNKLNFPQGGFGREQGGYGVPGMNQIPPQQQHQRVQQPQQRQQQIMRQKTVQLNQNYNTQRPNQQNYNYYQRPVNPLYPPPTPHYH